MKRVFSLIIFITIFTGLLYLNHLAMLLILGGIFGFEIKASYFLYLIISAVIFPVSMILLNLSHFFILRLFYIFASLYIGFAFLLLPVILFLWSIFQFILLPDSSAAYIVVLAALYFAVYSVINARRIKINEIPVFSEKIKDTTRILQLSDLHLGPLYRKDTIKRIVQRVINLNPDIVVITGDFADLYDNKLKAAVSEFNKIPVPIYFVTGNHEFYKGIRNFEKFISGLNFKILRKETVSINDEFLLSGIDDTFNMSEEKIPEVLSFYERNNSIFSVLLSHQPLDFKYTEPAGFDLTLSGHTHNGQLFPFHLLLKLKYKYTGGLYYQNGRYLYVSSGTLTWGPPLRLFSSSEINVINLYQSPSPDGEEE